MQRPDSSQKSDRGGPYSSASNPRQWRLKNEGELDPNTIVPASQVGPVGPDMNEGHEVAAPVGPDMVAGHQVVEAVGPDMNDGHEVAAAVGPDMNDGQLVAEAVGPDHDGHEVAPYVGRTMNFDEVAAAVAAAIGPDAAVAHGDGVVRIVRESDEEFLMANLLCVRDMVKEHNRRGEQIFQRINECIDAYLRSQLRSLDPPVAGQPGTPL
jgi:hypothetical protein